METIRLPWWKDRPMDSPVEQIRKAGPTGNGDWPGFDAVYSRIAAVCEKLSRSQHLSELHEETMAILGSGHEERMKAHLEWLRMYGWIE